MAMIYGLSLYIGNYTKWIFCIVKGRSIKEKTEQNGLNIYSWTNCL